MHNKLVVLIAGTLVVWFHVAVQCHRMRPLTDAPPVLADGIQVRLRQARSPVDMSRLAIQKFKASVYAHQWKPELVYRMTHYIWFKLHYCTSQQMCPSGAAICEAFHSAPFSQQLDDTLAIMKDHKVLLKNSEEKKLRKKLHNLDALKKYDTLENEDPSFKAMLQVYYLQQKREAGAEASLIEECQSVVRFLEAFKKNNKKDPKFVMDHFVGLAGAKFMLEAGRRTTTRQFNEARKYLLRAGHFDNFLQNLIQGLMHMQQVHQVASTEIPISASMMTHFLKAIDLWPAYEVPQAQLEAIIEQARNESGQDKHIHCKKAIFPQEVVNAGLLYSRKFAQIEFTHQSDSGTSTAAFSTVLELILRTYKASAKNDKWPDRQNITHCFQMITVEGLFDSIVHILKQDASTCTEKIHVPCPVIGKLEVNSQSPNRNHSLFGRIRKHKWSCGLSLLTATGIISALALFWPSNLPDNFRPTGGSEIPGVSAVANSSAVTSFSLTEQSAHFLPYVIILIVICALLLLAVVILAFCVTRRVYWTMPNSLDANALTTTAIHVRSRTKSASTQATERQSTSANSTASSLNRSHNKKRAPLDQ